MMRRSIIVLSLAAACGQVKGPGAGGGDGGAGDGGVEDAAVPGLVEVTVLTDNGTQQPKADVPVVFFQPDGSEAAREMTDGDGTASAELLPGGALVVFTHPDAVGISQTMMLVAVGVKPGDHIVFGRPPSSGELTAQRTISLPGGKANSWALRTTCGASGPSDSSDVLASWFDWCDASPTGIIGIMNLGENQYEVIGEDIEIIDDLDPPVPVDGEWQLVTSPDITVEGLDDMATMSAVWRTGRVSGRNIDLLLASTEGDVDSDSLTLAPPKIAGPDHVLLHLGFTDEQYFLGYQDYFLWREGGGDTEPLVLDMADVAMPRVGLPYYDLGTRTFGWPVVGDGTWDATYLTINWQDYAEGPKKLPPTYGYVRIVAPPGVTEVVLPPLPEEFEAWLPETIDYLLPQLKIFDSDALDWDEARQLGLDPWYLGYPFTIEPATVRYAQSRIVDG